MGSPETPARKVWLPPPWRQAMSGLKPVPALFGFTGRLSLRQFYILLALYGLASGIVFPGLGLIAVFLPSKIPLAFLAALFVPIVIQLWVCLAILAKRLHVRGRSAWFLLVFLFGAFGNPGSDSPAWYLLGSFLGIVAMVWLIIETYILPGTPGPNRFGPSSGGAIVPTDTPAPPTPLASPG